MEIDNAISRFLYIDRYTCIYLYLLHVCLSACVCIYMCVCLWAHRRKYIYIPMKENLCLDLLKDKYTLLNSKPTVSIRNSHAITLRYYIFTCHFPRLFHSLIWAVWPMIFIFLMLFITYVSDEERAEEGIYRSQCLWWALITCTPEDNIPNCMSWEWNIG